MWLLKGQLYILHTLPLGLFMTTLKFPPVTYKGAKMSVKPNHNNNPGQYFLALELVSVVFINLSPVPSTFSGTFEVHSKELQNQCVNIFPVFNFDSLTFDNLLQSFENWVGYLQST